MKTIGIFLFFVVLAVNAGKLDFDGTAKGGEEHHHEQHGNNSGEISEAEAHDGASVTAKRWIKSFLRHYCTKAEGEYDLCRRCVHVACLRYMNLPSETLRYDNCVDDHNRCCTKKGASVDTATGATKCYATGWISEVGFGQLSVVRAATGGQAKEGQSGFTGQN